MAFTLYDSEINHNIVIDLSKTLTDGEAFGQQSGTTCYLPVFMSKHAGTKNTW